MKKILLSLAVLATVASCSKNEAVDGPQTKEIGFSTLNDRLSLKSANDEADPYQVYAVASSDKFFIDNLKVSTDAATNKDSWAGHYYWFGDGTKIDFYAYAGDGATVTGATTTSIPVAYTVPAKADDDFTTTNDLDRVGATKTTVDFTFNHMLSKVSVAYALAEEVTSAGYTINDDATATLTVVNDNFTADLVAATVTAGTAPTTAPAYSDTTSYMVMPQTTTGCTVQLNDVVIKAKDGSVVANRDLTAMAIPSSTLAAFKAGEHYLMTITINLQSDGLFGPEIMFTSKVAEWTKVTTGLVQPPKPASAI